MEVFVTNIDPNVSKHDIIRAIASEVHRSNSPYTITGVPINFHFRLFVQARHNHAVSGALTFTTKFIGDLFLSEFGKSATRYRAILLQGKTLAFRPSVTRKTRSPKQPDPQILERIRTTEYTDPEKAEAQALRAAQLEEDVVYFRSVQFGWECRDETLSIEWEYDGKATLSFVPDKHIMAISLGSKFQIVLKYGQIQHMSWMPLQSTAGLFLRLRDPPIFLKEAIGGSPSRLSSLPFPCRQGRAHSEISPYLSLVIFLVFEHTNHLTSFLRSLPIAQVPLQAGEAYYPIEKRGLFSRDALVKFFSWANSLKPFALAFGVNSLLYSQAVDPVELIEMREEIQSLVKIAGEIHGTSETAIRNYIVHILEEFGTRALVLSSTDEKQDISLRQCFTEVIKDSKDFTPLVRRTDPGIFMCFHIFVTPTGLILNGPLPEMSNTVIRKFRSQYHSRLIRISFVDEGKLKLQHSGDYSMASLVDDRVRPILRGGLDFLGRHYQFLCYSMSALKQHTAWFFSEFMTPSVGQPRKVISVTRQSIISSLGSFHDTNSDPNLMHCPARYAARISQNFTSTVPTQTKIHELKNIPDIETTDNLGVTRVHTDGVGTFSFKMAQRIHLERLPAHQRTGAEAENFSRAVQIRFGGSKGMLSLDRRLHGLTVCLRPSMIKFNGSETKSLNIAKVFDRPGKLFLNRPLIMILEGLGVPHHVFEEYQDQAVRAAERSSRSLSDAAFFLESNGLGGSFRLPSIFQKLSKLGFLTIEIDPLFHNRLLGFAINHVLRVLKHKARIPIADAWNLPGICDIHDILGKNEIFACINHFDGRKPFFVQGQVLIWRSPVIHPGDVQIVNAIGPPPADSPYAKDPLANTLIFNVKDKRPISTTLGGGDVDGDEYQIIPLEQHPQFRIRPRDPADYPSAPRLTTENVCGINDIADFFRNFITSDNLGMIAIRWLEIADQSDECIFHPDCLILSELHSLAVDYPKSGRPVPNDKIPKLRSDLLPDWKAPETMLELDTEYYYESKRAIGRLFRAINLKMNARDSKESASEDKHRQKFPSIQKIQRVAHRIHRSFFHEPKPYYSQADPNRPLIVSVRMLVFRTLAAYTTPRSMTDLLQDSATIFVNYRARLQTICATYSLHAHRKIPLTEEEAVVGTIVASTSQPRHRQDQIAKLRDQTDGLVKSVQTRILGEETSSPSDRLIRAFLVWEMALRIVDPRPDGLLEGPSYGASSFNLIALGAVFQGIKEVKDMEKLEARD